MKPIRGRRGDIISGHERWDGTQEIVVYFDGHLSIVGAYAYRLYYYLWNHQNDGPDGRRYAKWITRRPGIAAKRGIKPPIGDLTNLLRHAEPTDNILPVIREAMRSLFALKNIEVTNKNMPSNSTIPIRLRLAEPPLRRLPVTEASDEELPF